MQMSEDGEDADAKTSQGGGDFKKFLGDGENTTKQGSLNGTHSWGDQTYRHEWL